VFNMGEIGMMPDFRFTEMRHMPPNQVAEFGR